MSAVLAFAHRGVLCAIPASQARAIDVRVSPEAQVALWPGEPSTHGRAVEVETAEGRAWVGCVDPRLVDLPREAALALSPLLREVLASLPHVVGVATVREQHAWLVDLSRFRPASASDVPPR